MTTEATPKLSYEELLARFDEMEATNRRLVAEAATATAARKAGISFKCRKAGEKYTDNSGVERTGSGVMSMYGVGKFPASYHYSQWVTIIEAVKSGKVETAIAEFLANGSMTKERPATTTA